MSVIVFIIILLALILVHEFGHFATAKFFKIRVDEFGVGFPPRLWGVKRGETEYTFNALPFGGFVRIFGEDGDEDASSADTERAISRKPRLVQAAVIVAGVFMNIVLAWLALSLGYMAGLPASADHAGFGEVRDISTIVVRVAPDSPALEAGILPGDRVVSISSLRERASEGNAEAVRAFIARNNTEPLSLEVVRGEERMSFLVEPRIIFEGEARVLGVVLDDAGTLTLPPHLALLEGARLTGILTVETAQGLGAFFGSIIAGRADFSSVAGPVGIVGVVEEASQFGFTALLTLTAVISINLALINLIPFPALDGGRLTLLAVEGIVRRPLPRRFIGYLNAGGFALLILLMVVVTYHDIVRLVS